MKLKKLAAALALAAAGAPAFAAIGGGNNAELFFVVWDETAGSYTKDLGVTLDSLLSSGASLNVAVAGTAWNSYLAADTNLADGAPLDPAGTRWAIFAVDGQSNIQPSGDFRYLTTATNGTVPAMPTNADFNTITQQLGGNYLAAVNATGTHSSANGESFNAAGSAAAYDESSWFGTVGVTAGNVIGAAGASQGVKLFEYENSSLTQLFLQPNARGPFNGAGASFDGTNLSLSVAAIPEPGSIALLLAGLSALGFVGRRRIDRD